MYATSRGSPAGLRTSPATPPALAAQRRAGALAPGRQDRPLPAHRHRPSAVDAHALPALRPHPRPEIAGDSVLRIAVRIAQVDSGPPGRGPHDSRHAFFERPTPTWRMPRRDRRRFEVPNSLGVQHDLAVRNSSGHFTSCDYFGRPRAKSSPSPEQRWRRALQARPPASQKVAHLSMVCNVCTSSPGTSLAYISAATVMAPNDTPNSSLLQLDSLLRTVFPGHRPIRPSSPCQATVTSSRASRLAACTPAARLAR